MHTILSYNSPISTEAPVITINLNHMQLYKKSRKITEVNSVSLNTYKYMNQEGNNFCIHKSWESTVGSVQFYSL